MNKKMEKNIDLVKFFKKNNELLNIIEIVATKDYLPTILSVNKNKINSVYEEYYNTPMLDKYCNTCLVKNYKRLYNEYSKLNKNSK